MQIIIIFLIKGWEGCSPDPDRMVPPSLSPTMPQSGIGNTLHPLPLLKQGFPGPLPPSPEPSAPCCTPTHNTHRLPLNLSWLPSHMLKIHPYLHPVLGVCCLSNRGAGLKHNAWPFQCSSSLASFSLRRGFLSRAWGECWCP